MAGVSIPESGGGRGKKSLDAEIQLVPFIDLLCSLISFLLMTAIWTQIARLELKQGNAAPPDPQATPTPKLNDIDLRVEVDEKAGFVIVEGNKVTIPVPCKQAECLKLEPAKDKDGKPILSKDGKPTKQLTSYYDYDGLMTKLKAEKVKFTDQKTVVVVLGDHVSYDEMIHTMDVCLQSGLDAPSISGTPL